MSRLAATLLLGAIALTPAAAGAGDNFACKDADGNWVLGNVQRDRCVGSVKLLGSRAKRGGESLTAEVL